MDKFAPLNQTIDIDGRIFGYAEAGNLESKDVVLDFYPLGSSRWLISVQPVPTPLRVICVDRPGSGLTPWASSSTSLPPPVIPMTATAPRVTPREEPAASSDVSFDDFRPATTCEPSTATASATATTTTSSNTTALSADSMSSLSLGDKIREVTGGGDGDGDGSPISCLSHTFTPLVLQRSSYEYTPTHFARDVREILIRKGIDRVHVMGSSCGAVYACAYVSCYPDSVLSLTLLAPWVAPSVSCTHGIFWTKHLVPRILVDLTSLVSHTLLLTSFSSAVGSTLTAHEVSKLDPAAIETTRQVCEENTRVSSSGNAVDMNVCLEKVVWNFQYSDIARYRLAFVQSEQGDPFPVTIYQGTADPMVSSQAIRAMEDAINGEMYIRNSSDAETQIMSGGVAEGLEIGEMKEEEEKKTHAVRVKWIRGASHNGVIMFQRTLALERIVAMLH